MLDINEIMKIIPQRAPFLMIDKVESYEPGKYCIAYKNVCINEPHFQGHFPSNPIMPGVLIIEALAQAGANIVGVGQSDMSATETEIKKAGRWGTPEDLAGTVVFLASKASDYVNGYTLAVDGGWLAR